MASVSDFVIDRLIEWDLHRFYGYPGDGIGGFDGALERAERDGKNFRYIRPEHEELVAFLACAHAKFTGEVGVAITTSGPGGIHAVNGLYDAAMDNQPVVAIVGQQGRVSLSSDAQQEINLERLYQDVAGYVQTVTTAQHAQMVVDRAVRIARAERCPTVVILPADVQNLEMETLSLSHWVSRTGVGHSSRRLTPPDDEVRRAAEVLNSGAKLAMLVGEGALNATDELVQLAERRGAGIITTILGKGAVPGDVPYHTQQLGLLGSRPSYTMMRDCDTLLMVGTNYPYAEFLPESGKARGVQIDAKAEHLSLRYPMEVNLQGDAKATLAALLPHLDHTGDLSWQQDVSDQMETWDGVLEAQAKTKSHPINPRYAYYTLNQHLPQNSIVTCDAGSTADWYGQYLKLGRNMMGNLSGRLASMLAAMPYAVSAKFAFPDRPVVCTIGDGAMQMLGMNQMLTLKRHWKEWDDPRFIVFVLHNNDLTQVSWEMREAGNPRYDTSQLVEDMNYADYAKLYGLTGIRVEKSKHLDDAWQEAFSADRPTVVDVLTDPNEPPLPPHISASQAKGYVKSLLKRDPAAGAVIGNSLRSVAAGLFASAEKD